MAKRMYEQAGTVIFDPVASNRNATRASLLSLGFRRVEVAPAMDALLKHLNEGVPDLLLAEVTGSEAELCPLIQAIRQSDAGNNPFMVVIVTTWRCDGSIVSKVVNCGADDLVVRPLSVQALNERIALQIDRRKGFVVTSDYIGPDRRDPSRSGSECIEVPNTLRLRTLDGAWDEDAERRILRAVEQGKLTVNGQKIVRDAVALGSQWRLLEQRNHGTRDFFDAVVRIGRLAASIKRRLPSDAAEPAGAFCATAIGAAETLSPLRGDAGGTAVELPPGAQAQVGELGRAALGLSRMFAPDEASASVAEKQQTAAVKSRTRAA